MNKLTTWIIWHDWREEELRRRLRRWIPKGVRVTCHNGHTSTLRDLRDKTDCSAPCCPRPGCDECSFTFEPSEALDA